MAIGGGVAAVVILLLRGAHDDVLLPPVHATELSRAAAAAGCTLRRGGQPPRARPAVEGRRAAPLGAGRYTDEQPAARVVGAMRRGTIVIHYRPDVSDGEIADLERLQRGLPRATILLPQKGMPYRLAATGWRRLLACRRLDGRTIDAIRLFRGRYVGQGPDTPR